MKIATDINQSKELAEILPKESADMYYWYDGSRYYLASMDDGDFVRGKDIAAWSLSALLEQIPSDIGSSTLTIDKCDSEPFKYGLDYHDRWGREDDIQTKYYDDLVDACVEMIKKLKKENKL